MLACGMELNLFKFYHLYTAWKLLYNLQVLLSMYCLAVSIHILHILLGSVSPLRKSSLRQCLSTAGVA